MLTAPACQIWNRQRCSPSAVGGVGIHSRQRSPGLTMICVGRSFPDWRKRPGVPCFMPGTPCFAKSVRSSDPRPQAKTLTSISSKTSPVFGCTPVVVYDNAARL